MLDIGPIILQGFGLLFIDEFSCDMYTRYGVIYDSEYLGPLLNRAIQPLILLSIHNNI